MQRITIERYKPIETVDIRHFDNDGNLVEHRIDPLTDHYSGVIRGVRNDDTEWVMYLDEAGSPDVFWSGNETEGVFGTPISLQPEVDEEIEIVIEADDETA